jgi:hypothetical protein
VAYHHWRNNSHAWTSDTLLLLYIDWTILWGRVLGALKMGRRIKGYSDVLSLNILLSEIFMRHDLPALFGILLVDGHMEEKFSNVPEVMYSLVALRKLFTVTSG